MNERHPNVNDQTKDTPMTDAVPHVRDNAFDRRALLRRGGLALSIGAIVSACAADFGGDTAPGRVGLADEPTVLPDGVVDDVVLVRTMQSMEHSVKAALELMTSEGMYSPALQTYVDRFVADHVAAAAVMGDLAVAGGGEGYACPNTWLMDRYITPIFTAVSTSDDVARDARAATYALETLLAHSYQFMVGLLTVPAHRKAVMVQGASASRRSATLAMQASAGTFGVLGPGINRDAPEKDEAGFPIPYAIPATFGLVSQFEVVVGAQDDEGARFSTLLQTPAENTFVYSYLSC
ncbi:MAG: hypothetical protein RIR49_830 [Actinomycetota bacterium]